MISLGELGPSDIAVIREVYDSDNAPEIFEMELERALQVSLRFRDIGVEWPIDQNYSTKIPRSHHLYLFEKVGCRTIVIEPTQLGEDTARWISIGDLFHKIALLSGCGSFAIGKIVSLLRLYIKSKNWDGKNLVQ